MSKKIDPILQSYLPIVKGLGKTLGSYCEIVLHDISDTSASIIAIENGHVTNRSVGPPATDLLLEVINSSLLKDKQMKLNYITKTKDGKQLKSSTILIRNEREQIIGALCINIDLTSIQVSQNLLEELAYIELEDDIFENFPKDASSFLSLMIENSLNKVNKPVPLLSKQDNLIIVAYLYQRNVFNIKGAVDLLANKLGVSKYTIYNYLDEVRAGDIDK